MIASSNIPPRKRSKFEKNIIEYIINSIIAKIEYSDRKLKTGSTHEMQLEEVEQLFFFYNLIYCDESEFDMLKIILFLILFTYAFNLRTSS